MLLRIVWALLPDEAQNRIAAQKCTLPTDFERSPGALILAALRKRLGYDIYSAWFAGVRFEGCDGRTATFSTLVRFFATWIRSHYQADLLALILSRAIERGEDY